MATPIRVLILEDRHADAELMVLELCKAGFEPDWLRVDTEPAFLAALDPGLDVILADHSMPQYDSVLALHALRKRGLDVPFIIVSGTIGEELAVRCLKEGAADYLVKDRLGRLGQAVAQALEQRELRREKRRAEELLLLQTSALAAAANGIVITDCEGTIRWANPAVTRMTGYELHELLGQNPRILKSGRQGRAFYEQMWQTLLAGRAWRGELTNRRKDGSLYIEEQTITPVRNAQGQICHFVGVKLDITERRQTEELLHAATEKLQSVIQASPLAIMATDRDGNVLLWNPGAERMFGWTEAEVLGHPNPAVPKEQWPDYLAMLEREFQGEFRAGVDLERRRKDDVRFRIRRWSAPIRNKNGQVMATLSIIADETDRLRLERELRQAQKMEAVGRLAGGVAHDFNNMLTVILGFSELLLGAEMAKEQRRSLLTEIHQAAEKAAGLTRQLLTFSRHQPDALVLLNLNTVVTDFSKMLRRLIGEDITLSLDLATNLGLVKADIGQMEQVLMNLAVNARDAMPGGGTLIIKTSNTTLDEATQRIHADVVPGPQVLLSVRDTGCGMTEAIRSRIFEPFFTTKEAGKGTGLGLATVYGIVKRTGGCIAVESEPGKGSTFHIYLPRSVEVPELQQPLCVTPRTRMGTETILLVEDDESLRGLARVALTSFGYQVLEAGSAAEALTVAERHPETIHLLITDVIMPGQDGRELAARLTQTRPAIAVLFISGYTPDVLQQHGLGETRTSFLAKPFVPVALARKVREVLDHAHAHPDPAPGNARPHPDNALSKS